MRSITFLFCCLALIAFNSVLYAQTGPNSPGAGANVTGIGANAWATPGNIVSSNGSYASVSTKGTTNYLSASSFGFAIGVPSAVDGISVEIERSTNSPTVVTVLNNWSIGTSKSISVGVNRCLVAYIFMENGLGPRNITAMTYGGQAMTKVTEAFASSSPGGFTGTLEVWRLLETGIAAAGSTNFSITYDATSQLENWESICSAVFSGVDQSVPVSESSTYTYVGTANPHTLGSAINTTGGGLAISGISCGNNTSASATGTVANAWTINSGFTEVVDFYGFNASFATSGGCYQVAHKSAASASTEAPTWSFSGTVNRIAAVCLNLQCIREYDNLVRMVKAGTITGSNFATATAWNTVDTYTTYGGSTNLWGTTWLTTDVNASNFGVVLSAIVGNGTARVDHVRITIFSHSTLPIELMDFYGEVRDDKHYLFWQTASEHLNKHFEIERSDGAGDFVKIATVNGMGTSTVFHNYEFTDSEPLKSLSYYRLKQVDFDDTFKYSSIIVIKPGDNDGNVLVYPNPSTGLFNIKASDQSISESVSIYASDFKLVKTVSVFGSELKFSLEECADGTYYLVHNLQGKQKITKIAKTCRQQ